MYIFAFLVLCNMKPSDSEDGSHECCPIYGVKVLMEITSCDSQHVH